MITLGGVTISDNMYLGGIVEAKQIAHKQERTVTAGLSVLKTAPTPGGRTITLESTNLGGSIQGIWCQRVIEQVKAVEASNLPVVLDHHGTTYNVQIVDTTQFQQMFSFEASGPDKKYTGKITTIEV